MSNANCHVELFTDGACSGNPGPGGWAYLLRDMRSGDEREASGGEPRTTNNRMELLSVIRGLEALDGTCSVELYSDSQYVVKGLAEWMDGWKKRGWRRPGGAVKNLELWKTLDRLREEHQISCHWVRGHNDHPENERCDRLAVAAAEKFK
jgi:ribonuclease HI